MSTVVSLKNIVTSNIPSKLGKNSQVMFIDKDSFFKKMISIYENSNKNDFNVSLEGDSSLNLMNIIKENNLVNLNGTFEADNEIISLDETNGEKKLDYDKAIDNFMVMMNYFNTFNEEETLNFEKLPKEDTLTLTNKLPYNFNSDNHYRLENTLHTSKGTDDFEPLTKENTIQASFEKLIDEINELKDKHNNFGNFNSELLDLKEPLINKDNKIVTLTDESSRIRSQVLSQVKDKIVYMAEEGTESGNKIKQVKMELQPHNLGKVDIKMTFEGNKISVEIQALSKETQKILSSNVEELTNILRKTTESSINVVVKNYESQNENHILNYNQNNGQYFKKDYDHQDEHSRQRNYYHNQDNENDNDEDSLFSELINLRNLKIQ